MSLTPITPNVFQNKNSPLGSGGINKNLLTPCRRVGLSRKRKTPSSFHKVSSPDLNCSTSINESETTPILHKKSNRTTDKAIINRKHLSRRKSKDRLISQEKSFIETEATPVNNFCFNEVKNNEKFSNKKKPSCRIKSDDLFNEESQPNVVVSKETVASSKGNKISQDLFDETDNEPLSKTQEAKTTFAQFKTEDFLGFGNTSFELEKTGKILVDDSDDDFQKQNKKSSSKNILKEPSIQDKTCIETTNKKASEPINNKKERRKSKNIRRILSMKKSSVDSFSDEEFQIDSQNDTPKIKNVKINLARLSENYIMEIKSTTKLTEIALKPDIIEPISDLNKIEERKGDIEKIIDLISDDEDAFTSTPEREINKKQLIQKIKAIELEVKEKRAKLTKLKQAAVYKSKHNPEELNKTKNIWMTGCASGLKDLLCQLKAHGPMDMNTLINNLRIPSDIVAKLPLDLAELSI